MKTIFFPFLFFLTVQFCCAWVCYLNVLGRDSVYGASSPRTSAGVSRWLPSQLGTLGLSLQVTEAWQPSFSLLFPCPVVSALVAGANRSSAAQVGCAPVLHTSQRCCQEMGTLYINYRVREKVKLCLHI